MYILQEEKKTTTKLTLVYNRMASCPLPTPQTISWERVCSHWTGVPAWWASPSIFSTFFLFLFKYFFFASSLYHSTYVMCYEYYTNTGHQQKKTKKLTIIILDVGLADYYRFTIFLQTFFRLLRHTHVVRKRFLIHEYARNTSQQYKSRTHTHNHTTRTQCEWILLENGAHTISSCDSSAEWLSKRPSNHDHLQ